MIPIPIILCLSGGPDSVVALYDLVAQGFCVHSLMFNYKQRHVQEIEFGKDHCGRLKVPYTVLEVPQLKGSQLTDGTGGVVVGNRNAILLSIAVHVAINANAELVVYGANKDDAAIFADCRPGFVRAFNLMLKAEEVTVQVCAPYINKAKWEIMDLGRQLGVDFNFTWSCYAGGAKPCGKCEACRKREEALNHK